MKLHPQISVQSEPGLHIKSILHNPSDRNPLEMPIHNQPLPQQMPTILPPVLYGNYSLYKA